MTAKPKWKRFEDLAAHIQHTLAPDATIERNLRVRGKHAGVFRDVDIAVRTRVAQYELFVAIDCKDYRRPVDVKAVEQFIGLVEDVGANKGAMISASGFTQAAKNRASDAGIDLHRLIDAEAHDWQTYVTIPALVEDCSISAYRLTFSGTGPIMIERQDFQTMMLFRADGTPIDIVTNLIADQWNNGQYPEEPGEHEGLALTEGEMYVRTRGTLYKVNIRATIIVTRTLYFGQIPLVEVKGFSDELRGGVTTTGFTTAPINFDEVQRTWQRVPSRDQLAVQPAVTLKFSNHRSKVALGL